MAKKLAPAPTRQPEDFGIADLAISVLICFINMFGWWYFKVRILLVTLIVFAAIEARRMTPEVAWRSLVAWLRGPYVPGIASRRATSLEPRDWTVPPSVANARPPSSRGRRQEGRA